MKNKIKKIIALLFFIIAIGMFVLLLYGIINVYFNGYETNYYTTNTINFVSQKNGIDQLKIYMKRIFGFKGLGIVFIPIYVISLTYIVIYLLKIKKGKVK